MLLFGVWSGAQSQLSMRPPIFLLDAGIKLSIISMEKGKEEKSSAKDTFLAIQFLSTSIILDSISS